VQSIGNRNTIFNRIPAVSVTRSPKTGSPDENYRPP
jgi:hypothetical protein